MDLTCDHWWWRPGWRQGRSFYTWHITFSDQIEVHQLLTHYASTIQKFPTLDPVTLDGLHLTIQGIGFTDEVDASNIDKIIEATRTHCSKLDPFKVTVGPPHADRETVQMPAQPIDPIRRVRVALRAGIGDIWGVDNIPESMDGFRPHVTLAYSNGEAEISAIDSELQKPQPLSAKAAISTVSLINLNRNRKRYEWEEVATVSLG